MFNATNKIVQFILFIGFSAVLSSCSSDLQSPEDRALSRWHALIELDWGEAYSFETPSYRSVHSLEVFKNNYGSAIEWRSIELESIKYLKNNLAEVTIILHVMYENKLPLESTLKERWLLIEKEWWHVES